MKAAQGCPNLEGITWRLSEAALISRELKKKKLQVVANEKIVLNHAGSKFYSL